MEDLPPIVFYGTSKFATDILEVITQNNIPVRGVVTAPDKPAGRGRKIQSPSVKLFALDHGISVFQPEKLTEFSFLKKLRQWNPRLQVVVAFRMLPEVVWSLPELGTFNLHASLLPQYRGAAPIQRALMNGENETGVTTFFINHEIDTGRIIMQQNVPISPDDNAGTLSGKLMKAGAQLVIKTIKAIVRKDIKLIEQDSLTREPLKKAPKITKEDCYINWRRKPSEICNQIRALSPVPGARTQIVTKSGKQQILKIFAATPRYENHSFPIPSFVTDNKNHLDVAVDAGFVSLQQVQLEGRKKMEIMQFLKGFYSEDARIL